jgi:tyrosyl-tRNA synthetase
MEQKEIKEVEQLLSRGIGNFFDPGDIFKNKLIKKIKGEYDKDIVIKFGVDPTRPDIHLGHAAVLRKLRKFQDFGCKIIFLIGDFTAQIGDPTGKSKVRPEVEQSAVEHNLKTYLDQAVKILSIDPKVFSWIRNSDWFTSVTDINLPADYKISITANLPQGPLEIPLEPNSFVGKAAVFEKTRMQIQSVGMKKDVSVITVSGFLWSLKHITHARLIERDMFKERIESGTELYMHEMLYPVLQAIDSSVLARVYGGCDLEIGGTDQTFNMLLGRDVMRANKQEEQAVLSVNILIGLDGKEKMSKSLENYVGVSDVPNDMFGKIMSIPDSLIGHYFELCTFSSAEDVAVLVSDMKKGTRNPRDVKARLAHEIVAIYHGEDRAISAESAFVETFKKGKVPEDVPEIFLAKGTPLIEVIVASGSVESKTDFKRLVGDGAVSIVETDEKISDYNWIPTATVTIRIGKKRFYKIIVA